MATSIFLAKIMSLYLIIVAISMVFNKDYYQTAALKMIKNNGLGLLTSIVTLILGLILVLVHNVWVADWQVLVTILAWLTLIKGVLRMALPETVDSWVKIVENNKFYYTDIVFMLILGLILGYYGFM